MIHGGVPDAFPNWILRSSLILFTAPLLLRDVEGGTDMSPRRARFNMVRRSMLATSWFP